MGARRKRSGGKRSTGEKRLARLADAGLVNRRDFQKRDGKLTKASTDRLRRLDTKIGKYLRSAEFTVYKPKTARERKALEHVLPAELRTTGKTKLRGLLIRTETRSVTRKGIGKTVKNTIRRITVSRDGTARVKTDGPTFLYPKLTRAELLDPKLAAKRIGKLAGKRRYLRVLTGVGTLNRMHPVSTRSEARTATSDAVRSFIVYSRDAKPGETGRVRGTDFVEGLMIEERRPAKRTVRRTITRTQKGRSRARKAKPTNRRH